MGYNIFISYRRKETADKAEHLFTLLESKGYKGQISLDKENFDGRFDLEILKRLDNCKDFIVVLSYSTLAKLDHKDDHWYHKLANCPIDEFQHIERQMIEAQCQLDFVRLEIARAIAKGKHIIPVVPSDTEDYEFSKLLLPSDIINLKKEHVERYHDSKDALFKDILPKIVKRLKSRRKLVFVPVILASLIFISVLLGIMKWRSEKGELGKCRTQEDYQAFVSKTFFFEKQAEDSLLQFHLLMQRKTPINDACNTRRADSISVNWNKKCSLDQLRVLRRLINNMMYVEKGTFDMGTRNPLGHEGNMRKVTISEDYYIGKFEVTELEWNVIVSDSVGGRDLFPIADVSWYDCKDVFSRKLQALTGLMFQLPTEAQWEYAARMGGEPEWEFSGGNNPDKVANYKESSINGDVEKVGDKDPNYLELYDMSGNVSEWCMDGSQSRRRVRGGSFMSSEDAIKVSFSDAVSPDRKSRAIGMRLVLIP